MERGRLTLRSFGATFSGPRSLNVLPRGRKTCMASGDRQRTWFPEMVEVLQTDWRPEMSWLELIALRDQLDDMLTGIRKARNLQPVTTSMLCPCCNESRVRGASLCGQPSCLESLRHRASERGQVLGERLEQAPPEDRDRSQWKAST